MFHPDGGYAMADFNMEIHLCLETLQGYVPLIFYQDDEVVV
jgi:hypothetical protein